MRLYCLDQESPRQADVLTGQGASTVYLGDDPILWKFTTLSNTLL